MSGVLARLRQFIHSYRTYGVVELAELRRRNARLASQLEAAKARNAALDTEAEQRALATLRGLASAAEEAQRSVVAEGEVFARAADALAAAAAQQLAAGIEAQRREALEALVTRLGDNEEGGRDNALTSDATRAADKTA